MSDRDPLYRRHRLPAEIIVHAVWLYFRFPLRLRMVDDLLAARGIIVSHQTVRSWAEKFGRAFANDIRRRTSGRLGDKWHLDEAVVSIRGKKRWLWRAVDQDGFVLDVLVQSRRNAQAAKRLMRKLLTMNVLNAIAQFERDLLIERTQSGLKRAKADGKTLGRPSTLSEKQKQDARDDLEVGMSVSAIARKFATSSSCSGRSWR